MAVIFRSLAGVVNEAYQDIDKINTASMPPRRIVLPSVLISAKQFCKSLGTPIILVPETTEERCVFQANPHGTGAQGKFLNDFTAKYCAFVSGVGGGKSWAGSRKMAWLHCANSFKDGRPTGVAGLIVSPTFKAAKTYNIPQMIAAFRELGIEARMIYDPNLYAIHIPEFDSPHEKSYIYVRSAESPLDIIGFECGHIWGDEAAVWYDGGEDPTLNAMVQADQRMRRTDATVSQFILTSTHQGDETIFSDRFERNRKENHAVYRGKTSDNARHLAAGYEDRLRGSLPPDSADQYLDGGVMSLKGGLVYNQFQHDLHVIDCAKFDQKYSLNLTFDFNKKPGSHAHLCQMDGDTAYARHEFFERGADARRLANLAAEWMIREFEVLPRISAELWRFPGVLNLFGDASGNSPGIADSAKCWEEVAAAMAQFGIPISMMNIPASNPPVSDRAIAVNAALKSSNGRTRFFLDRSCERLSDDFRLVRWEGNKISKKDKDVSHATDAIGYYIFQVMPVFDHLQTT